MTASSPIEFYFDFSSPYAYLASEQVEALAGRHGRTVDFRPILLGAIFKVSGQRPLTEIPLKGAYSVRDMARSARFAGIDFGMPPVFPIATVKAARACIALQERAPTLAVGFIHRAFRAYFVQGRDLSDDAVVRDVLAESGADADAVLRACEQDEVKAKLRAEVERAVARGVFGTPFFFVDGEPFWGSDRLPQVERWLASGPF